MTHEAPTIKQTVDERIARKRAAKIASSEASRKAQLPLPTGTAVSVAKTAAVTVPDNRSYRQRYLDEVAPASIVGRLIKFSKDGQFITADDEEPVPTDTEFAALCDQTLVGWLKFNGEGLPPDRAMGLLYGDFVMPPRQSLGDLDQSEWDMGLDGTPADPWQHHICIVLQNTATQELFTYDTSSKTGRRACGNLLRHYDRMCRTHPDDLPRVRLGTGRFAHKDARVGWVTVPLFIVIGRTPRDGVASPDPTTTAKYLDDDLPPNMK
jgi:hypothetical protein